tara:strand:- start:5866 stop:7503 length:1638 start_codon:yes stop_codon:yes gene_type:complete
MINILDLAGRLAILYLKKLYPKAGKKEITKYFTPENIEKQAEFIKKLVIDEQGNMSAKPFQQYINDVRYTKPGESITNPDFLRLKNVNALTETMEEAGLGNILFSKRDAKPFIEAQVIAGNLDYKQILDAWNKKYNIPLTKLMNNENISAYINVTLKRLNKPTKSQLRTDATQYKRSSIINAADELKKENKVVIFDTIYNNLLKNDDTKNIFKDKDALASFVGGQSRNGSPLNLTLDNSRSVAKTLSEAYQDNVHKQLTYEDTRNIISIFAKANKDKLLDLGLDTLVKKKNQPRTVMNFAATSKIRVDPDIATVDQLIKYLNSDEGMQFLKAIPLDPKFKKLLAGKSQENINMLADFFGSAQQKVRNSYPEILKGQRDINVIQGAHSYPSSYIKSIFQKGKIPNTEGGTAIKVTDEALQDLKALVDEKVIDIDMLPSELNYIQKMFDPRIIKGKGVEEFNTLYEKLGVTTIAPKLNAKGEVISFNLIGRVKELPVFSSQRQPGVDFQNIKQQMEEIAVDRSLDKYRKYKDGGFASIEEVLEYNNG